MPMDKSITILMAANNPAPKPSPHGLTQMFSMVAKGSTVPGQGQQSPRSSVPPVLNLTKGAVQLKGLGPLEVSHQEKVELADTGGNFLVGLDDS